MFALQLCSSAEIDREACGEKHMRRHRQMTDLGQDQRRGLNGIGYIKINEAQMDQLRHSVLSWSPVVMSLGKARIAHMCCLVCMFAVLSAWARSGGTIGP